MNWTVTALPATVLLSRSPMLLFYLQSTHNTKNGGKCGVETLELKYKENNHYTAQTKKGKYP